MCNGCTNEYEETEEGNFAVVFLTMGAAMLCFILGFILVQYV